MVALKIVQSASRDWLGELVESEATQGAPGVASEPRCCGRGHLCSVPTEENVGLGLDWSRWTVCEVLLIFRDASCDGVVSAAAAVE